MQPRRNAFSLLELTLVMTIIGLIAASFMMGKQLTKGADIRGLMRQYEKYVSAINSFSDRYDDLPGDFNSAYDYWPTACETEAFCNGDGDRKIEAYKESHLVWYHLEQANFIGGGYSGAGDGDDYTQTKLINVPEGALIPVQISAIFYEGTEFPASRHYIIFGAAKSEDIGYGEAFRPNDAHIIDEKFDDARPGKGKVFGRNGYDGTNYTDSNCLIDVDSVHVDNSDAGAEDSYYNNDIDSVECILALGF
jgi:prepilin-type N-terminal cleavage/methylation domain-containing protein